MGNGDRAQVDGVETYHLKLHNNKCFDLKDCLYAPSMRRNLLFVSYLEKLGFMFYFGSEKLVMYQDDEIILNGFRNSGMYQVLLCDNIVCDIASSSFLVSNDMFLLFMASPSWSHW